MKILFWLTVICYFLISSVPIIAVYRQYLLKKSVLMVLAIIPLCLHGLTLYFWIDLTNGQNLNFFNILSFSLWLIGVLVWVSVLIQPVDLLISFIYPLAAASMLLVAIFPSMYIIDTKQSPQMLLHILLSLLTFCILFVAGLLAVLLALQERLLRFNKIGGLIEKLPSLQTMETLLFQAVSCGFVLLTLVLITSFYSYHLLLWHHLLLLQKTLLVLLAWVVLFMLLIGRYLHGWRGRRAIYYTITGVLLLLAAYCLSKFVLEMLFK